MSFATFRRQLLQWLLEPTAHLHAAADLRRARWFAGSSLLLLPWLLFVVAVAGWVTSLPVGADWLLPFGCLGLLFLAYVASRTRWFMVGGLSALGSIAGTTIWLLLQCAPLLQVMAVVGCIGGSVLLLRGFLLSLELPWLLFAAGVLVVALLPLWLFGSFCFLDRSVAALIVVLLLGGMVLWIAQRYDTEHLEHQAQFWRERERQFHSIVEAMPLPVSITRLKDSTILYANARMAEALGMPKEQLIGQPANKFYAHPDERSRIITKLLENPLLPSYEVELKRFTGERFWAVLSLQQTTFRNQPVIAVGFYNVTKRREVEAALRAHSKELERLNHLMIGRELKMAELKAVLRRTRERPKTPPA